MPRIRITEKGWLGFAGNMGTAVFDNGEADLSMLEAFRIGANIQIHSIDEDGNLIEQVSPSLEITRTKSLSAELVSELRTSDMAIIDAEAGDDDIAEAIRKFQLVVGALTGVVDTSEGLDDPDDLTISPIPETPETPETPDDPAPGEPTLHTRASLEKVGDELGIKGLREIGDKFNVKSTAIAALIDGILEAQNNPKE